MVRVISEKLFSPPRSRHSSGETVDKELAARAVEALPSFASSRGSSLLCSDYESSSDSHWDSEVDFDGEGPFTPCSEAGGECGGEGGTDVARKRKERRRERNKVSAQAYRVRRREQQSKQQGVLATLHEENARLKNACQHLEEQISKVRESLQRHPHACAPSPSPMTPVSTFTPSDITPLSPQPDQSCGAFASHTTTFIPPSSEASCDSGLGAEASNGNGFAAQAFPTVWEQQQSASSVGFGSSCQPSISGGAGSEFPMSFDQLAQNDLEFRSHQNRYQKNARHRHHSQPVDNAQSRRQQISPQVDNFSFRRPSPSTSPCSSVSSVLSNPTTPTPTAPPSPAPSFTFPAVATSQFLLSQPILWDASATATTTTTDSQTQQRHPHHHLQQHHRHHHQQADLNANGNVCSNNNNNNSNIPNPATPTNNTTTTDFPGNNHSNYQHMNSCTGGDNFNQSLIFSLCPNDNAAVNNNNNAMNNNNNFTFLAVPAHFDTAAAAGAGVGAAQLQLLAPQQAVLKFTQA